MLYDMLKIFHPTLTFFSYHLYFGLLTHVFLQPKDTFLHTSLDIN